MADNIIIQPGTIQPDSIAIVPGVTETHEINISPPGVDPTTLSITENNATVTVISLGVPGPPGAVVNIPEYINATAGSILGGHRVVQIFDGVATYASNIDAYDGQLGLTMSSVAQGESFKAYTSGVVTEPSWNFTKGPVFLSINGLLTQTKPDTGTVILIGRAVAQTKLALGFQQLYKRG